MKIFELAHIQLMKEIDNGTRPLKAIEWNGKIYSYSLIDLIKYAYKIRKWIDNHSRGGATIESAVDRVLTGNKEYRRKYYLDKGV